MNNKTIFNRIGRIASEPVKLDMKEYGGFIGISIPTKKYIAAYIHHKLGPYPKMDLSTTIGNKLYDILEYKYNERKTEFSDFRYNAKIKIYITEHVLLNRGCNLNETNIKNFNLFVEAQIKERYRELMDEAIQILPSFKANLPEIRKKIGITEDDWDYDSIKKDYFRYRKRNNLPSLYGKNDSYFPRTVPPGKMF